MHLTRLKMWQMGAVLSVATLIGLQGCGRSTRTKSADVKQAGAADSAALPADTVIAKWNGGQMTYGELQSQSDSTFKQFERSKRKERYELEQRELDNHIVELLVKKAAKKAGKTEKEYVQAVLAKVEISDAVIQKFYDENVRSTGQPLEEVKDRIREYLVQQQGQQTVRAEIERLRAEAGVEIDFPAPASILAKFELTGRPFKGAADAAITIVEFADFQCGYCARVAPEAEALVKQFPNDVKIYFMHFPLDSHPQARPAAESSYCAHQQGKFWAQHDKIFAASSDFDAAQLRTWAMASGVNGDTYDTCLRDPATKAAIEADLKQGELEGVEGTPSFFVDGLQHQGLPSPAEIKRMLANNPG